MAKLNIFILTINEIFEIEDKLKMGLEAYYYSPQELNDGATGKEYWLFGFMVEKIWENFSVFINWLI